MTRRFRFRKSSSLVVLLEVLLSRTRGRLLRAPISAAKVTFRERWLKPGSTLVTIKVRPSTVDETEREFTVVARSVRIYAPSPRAMNPGLRVGTLELISPRSSLKHVTDSDESSATSYDQRADDHSDLLEVYRGLHSASNLPNYSSFKCHCELNVPAVGFSSRRGSRDTTAKFFAPRVGLT